MEKIIRAAEIAGISQVPAGNSSEGNIASVSLNNKKEEITNIAYELDATVEKEYSEKIQDIESVKKELKKTQAELTRWQNLASQAEEKAAVFEEKYTNLENSLEEFQIQVKKKALEESYEIAKSEVLEEVGQHIESLDRFLNGLTKAREEYLSNLEDDFVEIVFLSVGKILGNELESRKNILGVVRKTLRQAIKKNDISIHVSNFDFELLEKYKNELVSGVIDSPIKIVPDERIKIGGCIVEHNNGSIDARIEIQLEKLVDTLIKTRETHSK